MFDLKILSTITIAPSFLWQPRFSCPLRPLTSSSSNKIGLGQPRKTNRTEGRVDCSTTTATAATSLSLNPLENTEPESCSCCIFLEKNAAWFTPKANPVINRGHLEQGERARIISEFSAEFGNQKNCRKISLHFPCSYSCKNILHSSLRGIIS